MEEDGSAYYGGADGHFNQEGLYTGINQSECNIVSNSKIMIGEGGEYHGEMEQNYEGTYGEFQQQG